MIIKAFLIKINVVNFLTAARKHLFSFKNSLCSPRNVLSLTCLT